MGLTTTVELEGSLEGDLLLDVLGLSGGGEVLLGLRVSREPKRGRSVQCSSSAGGRPCG